MFIDTDNPVTMTKLKEPFFAMRDEAAILRHILPSSEKSSFWGDFTNLFTFALDFSEESLKNIRLHTPLFTGVPILNHAHQPYRFKSDLEKEKVPMIQQYNILTQHIPERYHCSEPVTTPLIDIIGLHYMGRFITDDLIRYQRCINNLYMSGCFDYLESVSRPIAVEVGGGYGSLAHQISKIIGDLSYIILDIPESLFWSAAYLINNNPQKSFYIYQKEDFHTIIDPERLKAIDFLFLPNYMVQSLKFINELNLLLNLLSFQEMTTEQVTEYAQIVGSTLKGFIYSENFKKHWLNTQLTSDVHEILSCYYSLVPDKSVYLTMPIANDPEIPGHLWDLFPFIGTGKAHPVPINFIRNLFYTPYGCIGDGSSNERQQ